MPEVVGEIERVVHTQDTLVPTFWVRHGDERTFDDLVRNDSTVDDVTVID